MDRLQLFHPSASHDHIARLMEVENKAWNTPGANIAASMEKIKNRVQVFSDGVTLAIAGNYSVGSQYAFRTSQWNGDPNTLTSWDDYTNYGSYEATHDSKGAYGFLVGVGVVPEFRGKYFSWRHERMKASELLIAYTLQTLFADGVEAVIGNARVPAYHTRAELTIEEYCFLRREDRALYDPVLRFHERMGARILKPVAYSLEDVESCNAGCWVIYEYPYWK